MLSTSIIAAAVLSAAPVLAHSSAVNAYWGQSGPDSQRLKAFCDTTALDYVTLAFVNRAPKSVGDLPGTNFAAHCSGNVYANSQLLSSCDWIRQDITYCQSKGKKILLSIGGVYSEETAITVAAKITTSDYSLPDVATGEWFAEYLWGAFGPYNSSLTIERPFDYDDVHVEVDGFDFDIEEKFDDQEPYVKCVEKLRTLSHGHNKILSAAPQCPVGDANEYMQMRDILKGATFDKIWIQYYNNAQCTGANFNLQDWADFLSTTPNSGAELYVGLYAQAGADGYVAPSDLASLISTAKQCSSFAGLMLWDANIATSNVDASKNTYLDTCASAVGKTVTTIPVSTSSSSVTASSTSSSSSTTISTTGSASATTTSSISSSSVSSTSSSASVTSSSSASSSSASSTSSYSASASLSASSSYSVSASLSSSSSHPATTSATASTSDDDYCEEETETASYPVATGSAYPSGKPSGSVKPSGSAPAGSASSYPVGSGKPSSYPSGSFTGYPTGRPSGVPSGYPAASISATSAAEYTTSTVTSTNIYTVTSCAPEVTNCPASSGKPYVTTEVTIYTTVCPVTATETGAASTYSAKAVTTDVPAAYSTSTIYSTKVYTITSCAATVTDCPARIGQTTSEVYAVTTTVVPVTRATATATEKSSSPSGSSSGSNNGSGSGYSASTPSGTKSGSGSSSSVSPAGSDSKAYSAAPAGSDSKAYSAVPAVSGFQTAYATIPVYPTGKTNSTIAATGTVKLPAQSSSAAASTGKSSAYPVSSSKTSAAQTYPTAAVASSPVTAGSAKAVLSFGAIAMALVALAM